MGLFDFEIEKPKPDTLFSEKETEQEFDTLDTWSKLPQFEIFLRTDYDDLVNFCKIKNKQVVKICNSRTFWKEKIKRDFGNTIDIDSYSKVDILEDIYAKHHIYNWLKRYLTYPISLNDITEMHYLSLDSKGLNSLPKSIFKLSNLTELNLSYNNFTKFPENLTGLKKLKNLNLSHNQLSEIPETIKNLNKLEDLNLSHNKFTTFPESLLKVYLSRLDLSYNQLEKIDYINYSLSFLNLSYNKLSSVNNLPTFLMTLFINDNNLSKLPDMNKDGLVTLNIYNNNFSDDYVKELVKKYPKAKIMNTPFRFGADSESESEVEANMDSGILINLAKHSELLGILNPEKVVEYADSFDYPTAKMICELSGKINEMCGSTSILKSVIESQVGKSTVKNLCKISNISHKFCADNAYWSKRAIIRFGEGYTQFAKEHIKSSKDYNEIFENGIKIELKDKPVFAKFAIGDATKLAVSTEKELYFWDVPVEKIVNTDLPQIKQVVSQTTSGVLGIVTESEAYLYKDNKITRSFKINKFAKWNSDLTQLAVMGTCKENKSECNIIVQNIENSNKNIDIITTGKPLDLVWSDDSSKIAWVTSEASTSSEASGERAKPSSEAIRPKGEANEVRTEASSGASPPTQTVYVYSFSDKSIKSYTSKDKISFVSITQDLTAIGDSKNVEIHGSTLAPVTIEYPEQVTTGELTKIDNDYKLLVGSGDIVYVHSLNAKEINIETATKIKTGNIVRSLDVSDNGKLVVTTSDDKFARIFFANA